MDIIKQMPKVAVKEIPNVIKTENKIEDQPSNMSSTSNNNPNQKNKNNNNFKPHNYGNTNFEKYHNQSKEVQLIAKRLQQVNIQIYNITLSFNK